MRYAIEKNGICSNIILADTPEMAAHIAGLSGATARQLGEHEIPVMAEPEIPVIPDYPAIPVVEFLRRFTRQERIDIREAATTNAVIADYQYLLDRTDSVHLNDADLIAGIEYLETAGTIAAGRAVQILTP